MRLLPAAYRINGTEKLQRFISPMVGASKYAARLVITLIALLAPSTVLALPPGADDAVIVGAVEVGNVVDDAPTSMTKSELDEEPSTKLSTRNIATHAFLTLPDLQRMVSHHTVADALPWLEELYGLVSQKKLENAVALLFDQVDELLDAGDVAGCNKVLEAVELERLDSNLLIGVLSVTVPAAPHLPFRPTLVRQIEGILTRTDPERVERLMSGLR